ncbi:hypothetical protein [Deinococcus sp. AJ005]|uniref:hypothetical protein n=1 Tax=Deinococcus sp. AJ005 TaxID=2652443 RepID=UPI00125CA703|nr:hypothetical protein [Deinococcus sp. AJ005]QFP77340.1 hypothetical protein DAAJ005_13385 [Deinococcus sp. AJ005]
MTRAPIKLSREMKLLLLLLLMVALIGAWYVWTNSRTLVAPSSPTGTTGTGTDPQALPSTGADPATGTAAGTAPGDTAPGNDGVAATGEGTASDPSSDPASATGNTPANGAATSSQPGSQPGTPTANAGQPSTSPNTGAAPDGTGLGNGADTVPLIPSSGASGQNGTGTGNVGAGNPGALAVQPNRPVEIEVIPPFPTPEVPSAPDGTATPGGINPQASIASVPRNNPFRPLSVDPSTQAGAQNAAAPVAASGLAGSGRPSNPQASTSGGSVQTTPITPSTNAGPLAISPIPGAGGSTGVTSGSTSGLPSIPGGDGSTGLGNPSAGLNVPGSGVTSSSAIPGGSGNTGAGGTVSGNAPGRTISGNSGDSGVTVIGGSTGATSGSGTAASKNPNAAGTPGQTAGQASGQTSSQGAVVITAPKPPKPIVPPITGMNVPNVTRVPVTPSRPAQGAATATTGAGRPGSTGSASGTPAPGNSPQVITSLGQSVAEGDATDAASSASKLDLFVQKQQLAFNAAVLGPINTAIFRGQDGYVVVAVGQTLPNSQVTVKEVSATSAVLSLGKELKTLELDQR